LLSHAHRFIADFLDAESLQSAKIVANSAGGFFAFSFALRNPERVRHLALVGAPFSIARPRVPLPMRMVLIPLLKPILQSIISRPSRGRVLVMWKRALVAHPERLPDALLALEVANQKRNHPAIFSFMTRLFDTSGVKQEFVLTDRWKNLSVPATFIWGERDVTMPLSVAEELAAHNPNFSIVRIPGAGHVPWFDNPGRVLEAINAALDGNRSAQ
jgi:pimeloyl-ACP methyl ester carboxylesterase